jgi:hypothetical protein
VIQLQAQSFAIGGRWRCRINAAALMASVTLAALILSSCAVPIRSFSATEYPDLNDPPPTSAAMHADELAQLKADLIRIRDDHQRVAARQQAFTQGPQDERRRSASLAR